MIWQIPTTDVTPEVCKLLERVSCKEERGEKYQKPKQAFNTLSTSNFLKQPKQETDPL
jgi:hypothetical protein